MVSLCHLLKLFWRWSWSFFKSAFFFFNWRPNLFWKKLCWHLHCTHPNLQKSGWPFNLHVPSFILSGKGRHVAKGVESQSNFSSPLPEPVQRVKVRKCCRWTRLTRWAKWDEKCQKVSNLYYTCAFENTAMNIQQLFMLYPYYYYCKQLFNFLHCELFYIHHAIWRKHVLWVVVYIPCNMYFLVVAMVSSKETRAAVIALNQNGLTCCYEFCT